jgi:hypothetical protein
MNQWTSIDYMASLFLLLAIVVVGHWVKFRKHCNEQEAEKGYPERQRMAKEYMGLSVGITVDTFPKEEDFHIYCTSLGTGYTFSHSRTTKQMIQEIQQLKAKGYETLLVQMGELKEKNNKLADQNLELYRSLGGYTYSAVQTNIVAPSKKKRGKKK